MENKSNNLLENDVFDHLWNGRYRMALPLAEKLFSSRPENSEAALYLAWAKLENGDPMQAQKYSTLSNQLEGDSVIARMIKGYLQMRLSSFEAAIYNFNMTEGKQKELLAWTYLNKAKSLAVIGETSKALNFYELALMIDRNANPTWKELKKYFSAADKLKEINNLSNDKINKYLLLAEEGLKTKEPWFTQIFVNVIEKGEKQDIDSTKIKLIELEAMFKLNQFTALEKKLDEFTEELSNEERFNQIKSALDNLKSKQTEEKTENVKQANGAPASLSVNQNEFISLKFAKIFNAENNDGNKSGQSYSEVDFNSLSDVGLQVVFDNPKYNVEDQSLNVFVAWYIDEDLLDQSTFTVDVPKDWDAMVFFAYSQISRSPLWQPGLARAEVFINRTRVITKEFKIGPSFTSEDHYDLTEFKQKENKIEIEEISLEEVLAQLDKIIGLSSVKSSVRELIDYLEYMRERKNLGLKAEDKVSVHATFLGNPGTGKTTVARMMGKIFRGMGLLEKGEVIEVDRSTLVGQYVGETAQKTEKIIESAIGNVLFIDEAYTLVKKGASNDFGQEAIDILLKRMEDRKGEFFVITAGYPNEMNDFLDSNPGLKSRFTHHFNFEDYTPEEMIQIFESMCKNEEYRVTNSGKTLLSKELTNLYRHRDQNFGNARTVRKIFEDAKMQVSKRYLSTPKHERTKEKLTTITEDDLKAFLQSKTDKSQTYQVPINEELLNESLHKLNKLIGLSSIKFEVNELVKLAKFYHKEGESLNDKFSSHILFLGNPGTGKTTVARIIADIYSALGILPNGQLIETDRQGLVDAYVGKTAIKTTEVINKSIGGTLFVDEAYTLVKKGSTGDFGQEAVDTLLKRMEDDRGKFIVIAAGYTKEMKEFLESNSGLKSRFTKTFNFEDYTPSEMIDIFNILTASKKLKLDKNAKEVLENHFNTLYRERDEHFGNARVVRNTFDAANKKHLIRMVELNDDTLSPEVKSLLTIDDFDFAKKEEKTATTIIGDEKKLQEYLNQLEELVGLDSVKDNVNQIVNSLKIAQIRKDRGLQVISKPLHTVFTGNPGTGKTTVARLLSNIFKELGILEKGHLVEVDRAQLVAGYSGQTAIKTDEVIKKALGGTLFIDEAYTLSRGGSDFGQEAIDTLLKRMEDYKGKFIVIAAGYTNEMKQFLETNPGITSRFTNNLHFEDYNPEQLLTIAEKIASSSGYKFNDDGKVALIKKFETLYENRDHNFGNARTARNTLMEIITKQESRLATILNPTDNDLVTLTNEDIFIPQRG